MNNHVQIPDEYLRIECKSHGWVLYTNSDPHWFDSQSQKLYKDLCFLQSFNKYDCFLSNSEHPVLPFLKKVGEDIFIKFPFNAKDVSIDILYEIPTDGECSFFICYEDLGSDLNTNYEYFLLIVTDKCYTFTSHKRSINELYIDFPHILQKYEELNREVK